MAYATVAELALHVGETELVQLTDPQGTGVVGDAAAQRALDDAAAEIDAYVGRRYALPLAAVPSVLRLLVCDVARYRLWRDAASAEVRQRYEDARRLLERIADGGVALPLNPAATTAASGVGMAAATRVMPPPGY